MKAAVDQPNLSSTSSMLLSFVVFFSINGIYCREIKFLLSCITRQIVGCSLFLHMLHSLSVYVCLLVVTVSPAKVDKPFKVPFGCGLLGPTEPFIGWG